MEEAKHIFKPGDIVRDYLGIPELDRIIIMTALYKSDYYHWRYVNDSIDGGLYHDGYMSTNDFSLRIIEND